MRSCCCHRMLLVLMFGSCLQSRLLEHPRELISRCVADINLSRKKWLGNLILHFFFFCLVWRSIYSLFGIKCPDSLHLMPIKICLHCFHSSHEKSEPPSAIFILFSKLPICCLKSFFSRLNSSLLF